MSRINVPLAEEVLRSITAQPEEHDQASWFEVTDFDNLPGEARVVYENEDDREEIKTVNVRGMLEGSCGSTACVAGWAALLSGWEVNTVRSLTGNGEFVDTSAVSPDGEEVSGVDFELQGREALELSEQDARFLFFDTDDTTAIIALYGLIKGVDDPFDTVEVARHLGLSLPQDAPNDGWLEDDELDDLTEQVLVRVRDEYPPLTLEEWLQRHASA